MKLILKPLFLFALAACTAIGARANGEAARTLSKLNNTEFRTNLLDEIPQTENWTVYKETSTFRIEYKFQECNSSEEMGYRNMNVIFFRFTNLTRKNIELTWVRELYVDGECANCDELDHPEHAMSLQLKPKEIVAGHPDFRNDALGIPANFIKLVKGMSGSKVTNFELINLEAKVIK